MSYFGRLAIEFIDARAQRPVVWFARCGQCGLRHHQDAPHGTGSTKTLGARPKRERQALTLTEEQRFLLLRGVHPRLAFSAKRPAPVAVGHVRMVSPQVELEIIGVRRSRKADQWELDYRVRDHRPVLLRRVPPVFVPQSDRQGPVLPPSRGEIEVARLEGSYTHSEHGAVTDAGEDVPASDHNLLVMTARQRWADKPPTKQDAERQERSFKGRVHAVMQGLNPMAQQILLARLQEVLEEHEDAEERQAA